MQAQRISKLNQISQKAIDRFDMLTLACTEHEYIMALGLGNKRGIKGRFKRRLV